MENLSKPLPGRNYYLIAWCRDGLESLIDLKVLYEEYEKQEREAIFKILSNSESARLTDLIIPFNKQAGSIVQSIILRAKFNSHRNMEVYTLMTDMSIDYDMIKCGFETDPQLWVDTIRERGCKLYSSGKANDSLIK